MTFYREKPETYEDVEAIPMVLPDFVNVEPKDPSIIFRWVNFNVGEKRMTLRYDQMRAAGFVNATIHDIKEGKISDAYKAEGNRIVNGDLILMKIKRSTYRGWMKWNREAAIARAGAGRKGTQERGKRSVAQELDNLGAPSEMRQRIQPFVPSDQLTNTLGHTKPSKGEAGADTGEPAVKPPTLKPPAGPS